MERAQRRLGAFGVQEEKGNEAGHIQGSWAWRREHQREVLIFAATGSRAPAAWEQRGDMLTGVIRENSSCALDVPETKCSVRLSPL